jgi:hypothetical protein
VVEEGTTLNGVGESATLRMMMLGLDTGLLTGGCATAAGTEGCEKLTVGVGDESAGKELDVNDGFRTEEDVHAESITVTVDSKKTVWMPSAPVDVKAEMPFGNSVGAGGEVGMLLELKLDEEEEEEVVDVPGKSRGRLVEGTIPPKLKVLVAEVELNWRLFSLMTDGEGEATGLLRLIMGGAPDGSAGAPT